MAPVRDRVEIVCDRDDLDGATAGVIALEILEDLSERLAVAGDVVPRVRVIVEAGPSSADGGEIRLGLRGAGRGYTTMDWFELLFAHELTHVLVREAWGLPPALVWEGLAVHLGDDRVRTRLFGTSYHAYCRALDARSALLPLAPLLRASTYYRRRSDFRVDLEAGSFSGYLLATRGPGPLARFAASSPRPSCDSPEVEVDPVLRRHLGASLALLEAEWIGFLRSEVPEDEHLQARLGGRELGSEGDGLDHCDHCFAPVDSVKGKCVGRRCRAASW